MYQTIGHNAVQVRLCRIAYFQAIADAMCLPLVQFTISGKCLEMDMTYQPKSGDEVEDLYSALLCVKVWRIEFG